MKKFTRSTVLLIVFTFLTNLALAQPGKVTKYPSSFALDKTTLNQLFAYKVNTVAKIKSNKYINGSTVLLNSTYLENKQLKLKLSYFKNADLYVQINGKDSKILYILSSDDSIFYIAKETEKGFTFTQCKKDDIVSE